MIRRRHSSSPSAPVFRRRWMNVDAFLRLILMLCLAGMVNGAQAQTGNQSADLSGEAAASSQEARSSTDMRVQRIGLIDIDGVIRASKGTARVRELLDEQRQLFQAEFAARETALQESERRLIAQRDALSETEFARQLSEFEAEVATIQKEIQYRREAIDIAFQEAQENLRRIALEIVTDVAREMRLDFVLERESVLIFVPRFNISDEVLRRLDERTKAVRIEVTNTDKPADE